MSDLFRPVWLTCFADGRSPLQISYSRKELWRLRRRSLTSSFIDTLDGVAVWSEHENEVSLSIVTWQSDTFLNITSLSQWRNVSCLHSSDQSDVMEDFLSWTTTCFKDGCLRESVADDFVCSWHACGVVFCKYRFLGSSLTWLPIFFKWSFRETILCV